MGSWGGAGQDGGHRAQGLAGGSQLDSPGALESSCAPTTELASPWSSRNFNPLTSDTEFWEVTVSFTPLVTRCLGPPKMLGIYFL